MKKKVAIIGGGVSGISAAYNLWKKGLPGSNITLFESGDKLGEKAGLFHNLRLTRPVDIDSHAFNPYTSPLLLQFFRELDVEVCDSDMSFSVESESFTLGTRGGIWSLVKSFIRSPLRMLQFLWTLYKFFSDATSYVKGVQGDTMKQMTLYEYCSFRNYEDEFTKHFVIPCTSSVLCSPTVNTGQYDAFTIFTSMANNNLLSLKQFMWKALTYSSENYISSFLHKCKPVVHLNTKITTLKQCDNSKWLINGSNVEYDDVIFSSCNAEVKDLKLDAHSQKSIDMLNKMSSIQFHEKLAIIHSDPSYMPRSKFNWSSRNFKNGQVTYWLNSMQPIGYHADVFLSITDKEDKENFPTDKCNNVSKAIISTYSAFTQANVKVAEELRTHQGHDGLHTCGDFLGCIFLEDKYRSGYQVANTIIDRAVDMYETFIAYDHTLVEPKGVVNNLVGGVVYSGMTRMLESVIKKGCIGVYSPGHETKFFGESGVPAVLVNARHIGTVVWKWALQGDIGFAETYIEEHMEVDNLPLLIFYLVINTYPAPASSSIWRPVMFFFSKLSNRIMYNRQLKNTVSSAKQNIIDHYDLGNDFFETFLDSTMTYSSAIFKKPSEELETAQLNKYDRLIEQLELKEGDHVLEIGCGWGGMAVRAASTKRCSMTCVTISIEQAKYCRDLVARHNLENFITIREIDYRDIEKEIGQMKFDAIVSIEMIEAIGPYNYESYFRTIASVLKPNGKVAIQAITRFEDQYNNFKLDPDFLTKYIFPGGCLPSLGVIALFASRCGLVVSDAFNISKSYARTLELWRDNFNKATKKSDFKFDKRFIRIWNVYFAMSQAAFEASNVQNYQILLEPMRSDSHAFLI